jgi:hypothetical protein
MVHAPATSAKRTIETRETNGPMKALSSCTFGRAFCSEFKVSECGTRLSAWEHAGRRQTGGKLPAMALTRASTRLASPFNPGECLSASAYSLSTGTITGLSGPSLAS